MPITINGSGTVTGISVGGLPDGIVDTDMLASSVTTGKVIAVKQAIKILLPVADGVMATLNPESV